MLNNIYIYVITIKMNSTTFIIKDNSVSVKTQTTEEVKTFSWIYIIWITITSSIALFLLVIKKYTDFETDFGFSATMYGKTASILITKESINATVIETNNEEEPEDQ